MLLEDVSVDRTDGTSHHPHQMNTAAPTARAWTGWRTPSTWSLVGTVAGAVPGR
jgi:hypothetical protein